MSLDGWSEERVELLKELRKNGVSSTIIGKRLGVSRNAICGKAHRLGLSTGEKSVFERRAIARRRQVAIEQSGNPPLLGLKSFYGLHLSKKPRVHPIPPPQIEDIGRKSIIDLEEHDCRYPCGGQEPVQLFCGLPKESLDPDRPHRPYTYCAAHNARAYQENCAAQNGRYLEMKSKSE